MTKKDLDLIFIRAQNANGDWDSLSLRELLDMKSTGTHQIVNWFIQKTITTLFGLKEGQVVDEAVVVDVLNKMEALGITVVRANPELLKLAKLNSADKVKN